VTDNTRHNQENLDKIAEEGRGRERQEEGESERAGLRE
jgi:hypothetical protein